MDLFIFVYTPLFRGRQGLKRDMRRRYQKFNEMGKEVIKRKEWEIFETKKFGLLEIFETFNLLKNI